MQTLALQRQLEPRRPQRTTCVPISPRWTLRNIHHSRKKTGAKAGQIEVSTGAARGEHPKGKAHTGFAPSPPGSLNALVRDGPAASQAWLNLTHLLDARVLAVSAAGETPWLKEPSSGLEPETPSLPWRCSTN